MDSFKGVDLNDSFVLGWSFDDGRLCFELEASLWPQSPYYSEPKTGDYTCYKRATLEFLDVTEISGLVSFESVTPTQDSEGAPDYGNIDSLKALDGFFELSGAFGEIAVRGGELRFVVHT